MRCFIKSVAIRLMNVAYTSGGGGGWGEGSQVEVI